ncbi:MAG: nitroreductase family protein [Dysgonamonadaceae bacterium]|nr:nitroreductase family protein [Dysgonamonadaceae bacterium]
MNETLQTIAKRYSCRNFTDKVPGNEQLAAIAKAAIQSPSAMNRQPWRIVVLKNRQLIQEMEDEALQILASMPDRSDYDRIMSRGGKLFYNAPCMIMLPMPAAGSNGFEFIDLGIVCENIALAATSLGLGNVICAFSRLAFSGSKAEEFKQRSGFPDGFECGAAVLVGYAVSPVDPHEPDETKIIIIE